MRGTEETVFFSNNVRIADIVKSHYLALGTVWSRTGGITTNIYKIYRGHFEGTFSN